MKINQITGLTIFFTIIILSCQNTHQTKNKSQVSNEELLKKELELTKKELELTKKESSLISKSTNTVNSNPKIEQEKKESVSLAKQKIVDIHSDPNSVMRALFDAAKSGNLDNLSYLCDPTGSGDGETKEICKMNSMPFEAKKSFIEYFKNGEVIGNPIIIGDEASVDFSFGPNNTKTAQMKLIRLSGKWYLYSI